MLGMHDRGTRNLLSPERMGYVQDRDHVAGFAPHQFSAMPAVNLDPEAPVMWPVVRLELIGLLRHETPVAYVTDKLPRMDELADAPTRTLDEFEATALEELRAYEDVVIRENANRIRMVGSLRAGRTCIECHTVQRGELLGALSYELVPARAAKPAGQPEAATPQAHIGPRRAPNAQSPSPAT
jgi:hypothetical protein